MRRRNDGKDPMARNIGIGLIFGTAIGAALGNVGLGIALGLVFGAALAPVASATRKKDEKE